MTTSAGRTGRRSLALGIDYGTSSVRALVVDTATGEEIATSTWTYSHGVDGVITDVRDPNLARQHPADYAEGFERTAREAVRAAASVPGCSADDIVGIGVDTTGSTPLPVDASGTPLAMLDEFSSNPDAMAWLWKDHTSWSEAAEITERAAAGGEPYLAKCGGVYSSEWYWSKILRCSRVNAKVTSAAASWVELCDWVPGWLTGNMAPGTMARSICAAGHKAMYNPQWNGLPSEAFLSKTLGLPPGFRRAYAPAVASDRAAGGLRPEIAAPVGLRPGIPVAVGAFDAHMGAVGSGIKPGTLVKIMGTSTCDCMVWPMDKPLDDIPGVCGIVPESILPGMYGIEAGQSAVGDIFNWCSGRLGPAAWGASPDESHRRLTEEASRLRPGESGLVALDWNNGNRTVLVDPRLTGLLVGQTLATTAAEVYLALIEATAFGALKIIDRIEQYGVKIEEIINCGGIAEKSPLVMQVYADVTGRPMKVSRSGQTCALGAAIFGAVVGKAHPSVAAAQAAMTGVKSTVFRPRAQAAATYKQLFGIYSRLHDAFGVRGCKEPVGSVMKDLISLREAARTGAER